MKRSKQKTAKKPHCECGKKLVLDVDRLRGRCQECAMKLLPKWWK